jgi:ABC-2 type transport system ATP-binding protein
VLVVEGLRKAFGPVTALDGFDLTVRSGEVVGLIGHNGSGKTTFARVVAGLVRPDAGRVRIGGADSPDRRGLVGFAPQEPALYPTATVRENLRVFGGLAGLRGAALRREIDAVAPALDLAGVLDRRVATLSGGQFRRVQAATALLHRPPVLLLDEPTVGVDPPTRAALLRLVRERAASGTAVCYTTHYLPELDELGATLAVAARGRIVARGTRADLLAGLPGELRVRFAGPAPARLAEGHPDRRVEGGELRVCCADPAGALAGLLRDADSAADLSTVDVRHPSLDDLYHRLAVEVPPPAETAPAPLPVRVAVAGRGGALRQVAVLCRHNATLLARDPHHLVAYVVMPMVLMTVLRPLYTAALDRLGTAPGGEGSIQAAAGMTVMFSLLALNIVGSAVLAERTWHTLDRLRTTPATAAEVLAGKALPLLVVLLGQQAVLLGFAAVTAGLRVTGPVWLVALAGTAWALCVLACGTALATVARTQGQLATVCDVGSLVATCLGGALVPLAALPEWVRHAAPASFGYWGMGAFQAALRGEVAGTAWAAAVLLTVAIAAGTVAYTRITRGLAATA